MFGTEHFMNVIKVLNVMELNITGGFESKLCFFVPHNMNSKPAILLMLSSSRIGRLRTCVRASGNRFRVNVCPPSRPPPPRFCAYWDMEAVDNPNLMHRISGFGSSYHCFGPLRSFFFFISSQPWFKKNYCPSIVDDILTPGNEKVTFYVKDNYTETR